MVWDDTLERQISNMAEIRFRQGGLKVSMGRGKKEDSALLVSAIPSDAGYTLSVRLYEELPISRNGTKIVRPTWEYYFGTKIARGSTTVYFPEYEAKDKEEIGRLVEVAITEFVSDYLAANSKE